MAEKVIQPITMETRSTVKGGVTQLPVVTKKTASPINIPGRPSTTSSANNPVAVDGVGPKEWKPSLIPKTQTPSNVADVIAKAQSASESPSGVAPTDVQPLTTKDVLGSENVEQALTEPTAQPDTTEATPVAETGSLEANKQSLADLQNVINVTTQALEEQNKGALGTTGASLNLIGRQIGSFERSQVNKMQALQNTIDIQEEARAKIENLMLQTGGQAGIEYGDSFEDAIAKAGKYQMEKEEADLDRMEKADLEKMAMSLGLSTKGSSKDLRNAISKSIAKDRSLDQRMAELTLRAKEKSYRDSMTAEANDNIDTGATIQNEFNSNNSGLSINTTTGDQVDYLANGGY